VTDPALRLRDAGLRVTRSRLAILRLLEELGGHHSADELVDALRSGGSPIPRATVYHVLETLGRRGLVLLADAGPGRTLYESAADGHHHLVCRACGRIVDVPCLADVRPCLNPTLPGVVIEEAQVIFRGLCAACAMDRARARPETNE
jgi:Fur family ferric uptake transcriptional regulator